MTPDDSDMPDAVMTAPRRKRVRVALLVLLAIALVAFAGLWSQRKPIASDYIDRYLAERGVLGRYRIADLGLGRQRLTNVVLGPAAHPDLIADWIELRTHVGWSGLSLDEVRVGHVRLRGRIVDGRLSLGSLDRLLPPSSGKPFALPSVVADIEDARMRLETPQGVIGLKASGYGALNSGFDGHIAAVADHLSPAGCTMTGARAILHVSVRGGAPSMSGPVRLSAAACPTVSARELAADVTVALSAALDHGDGTARLALARLDSSAGQLRRLAGTMRFAGSGTTLGGDVDLAADGGQAQGWSAATIKAAGRYAIAAHHIGFEGKIGARQLVADPKLFGTLAGRAGAADGTPFGPLVRRFAVALTGAGRNLAVDGDVGLNIDQGKGQLTVTRLLAVAQSGAQIRLAGGKGATYRWPDGVMMFDGTATFGGGGLPAGRVDLSQAGAGAPITGLATLQPYAAGNARLAAAPIRFTMAGGVTRVATTLTLSGPLGDGLVEGVTLPIDARWQGGGALLVNPACAPLSFRRLALASFSLRPATLTLCPRDGALYRLDRGVAGGGVRIAGATLTGAIGTSLLALSATTIDARFATPGFAATGLAVRIGTGDSQTRLDFATLGASYASGRLAGRFDGGAGQIGTVPLALSKAAGAWRFGGGVLAVTAALAIDDTATAPRFKTLAGRNVDLVLRNGLITATGDLVSPGKNIAVAKVMLAHDLSHGTGHADLAVDGIAFSKTFQPEELTPLTFGVIADVNGTVSGEGHIRWTPDGVTSDGRFRTAGTDLAAALGPVTGIAGEIRFTDLLSLQSAPGQIATIKSINPGVAVTNGTIRYQTLPGARINVEGAEWPFAGGTLALAPTLLDFDVAQQRNLTFRVTAVDAGQFLQQFDFKNLDATGTFDGTLPMIFDQSGGRIENGRLKVRPGGGTIAYLGAITEKDVGFWGNLAFQALRSLNYRDLDIVMNGPLSGEVITEVRFAGVSQGAGAKRNFIFDRLQKLPFVFNVRIKAPFRSLIDSAQSLYDPRRLIERNLPALIEEQNKRAAPPAPTSPPVQPSDSRTMP